jgi:hypothetical protein
MAESSRETRRGKKKGIYFPTNVVPSPSFSTQLDNVPSAKSGAETTISSVEENILLEIQQAQDSKYPLWKYVTRHQGPGSNLKGGANILRTCNFFKNQFTST